MKIKKSLLIVLALTMLALCAAFTACGETKKDPEKPPSPATLTEITVAGHAKTAYTVGETFDPTDMTVTARYSDGTGETVTDYTVIPNDALSAEDKAVTVSYTAGGVTKTAKVTITVTNPVPERRVLSALEISDPPAKTDYFAGETFDPTGMIVTARYSDGTGETVTDYTVIPNGALSAEDKAVTVSYTAGGVTKTANVEITVTTRVLSSISVTTPPDKVNYVAGEWFDPAGMVVTAHYEDGGTAVVTDYKTEPGHGVFAAKALREDDGNDDKEIKISYTENGVTVSVKQDITVTPATAEHRAALRSGDRYEAEYATAITGVNANGKKGFVRPDKNCIGGMARTGNCVTFTVYADKKEDDVSLIVSLAAMNESTASASAHKEAVFDEVYTLNVNGVDLPQGKDCTFNFEGRKEQWFDWVELTVTIDLKQGENVIKFTVPELPASAPADTPSGNYSLYIGTNFNYIAFETKEAGLSYEPNFTHARW